MQLGQYI
jgi:hypothetical protein